MEKPRTPLIVWLALGLVIGAMLAVAVLGSGGGVSAAEVKRIVVGVQVGFEDNGEGRGLTGEDLRACLMGEPLPICSTPITEAPTTTVPPPVVTTAPAATVPATLPPTITPPSPATTADHRD